MSSISVYDPHIICKEAITGVWKQNTINFGIEDLNTFTNSTLSLESSFTGYTYTYVITGSIASINPYFDLSDFFAAMSDSNNCEITYEISTNNINVVHPAEFKVFS